MRKIVHAIVAGSLLVGGTAYAAGTTTPPKNQVTKQEKAKHASKHAKKATKPAANEPKSS